jgi:EAL domain-containing protein (putative c-di-GMP-specific phosphodiesterase class I)/ABC-type amino acid transport substrate-binding protein
MPYAREQPSSRGECRPESQPSGSTRCRTASRGFAARSNSRVSRPSSAPFLDGFRRTAAHSLAPEEPAWGTSSSRVLELFGVELVLSRAARCAGWALLILCGIVQGAQADPSKIVFGVGPDFHPFEWSDGGEPRGFNIEFERAIAELGGAEVEYRLNDWPETVRALQNGEVDVVPMFNSAEREQDFLFTPPFEFINHGVYARKGAKNIASVEDLAGYRVAVADVSYAHQQLGASRVPIDLVLTRDMRAALGAVADGRADYGIAAAPTADYLIRSSGWALRNVGPPLWPRGYAFAVRRDRVQLAEWLTRNFYDALKTGVYQQTYGHWKDQLDPTEASVAPRGLQLAVLPLSALALLAIGWAWRLRRRVLVNASTLDEEARRREAAESHARWVADHDENTGLPRLDCFLAQVERLLSEDSDKGAARKQVVVLKLADVDRTMRVRGREAGLSDVREFAQWLRSMEFDAYGKDGRDVLLVFGDVRQIGSRLRQTASPSDTAILRMSRAPRFFAGAATWPDHGRTSAELLRRAEAAMAMAAKEREGWAEYRHSMEPEEGDVELVTLFRESAGAGMHPRFQPQIDLRSGSIVGAEALVRWNAPHIGFVPPAKFIPMLEDAGLVGHVTRRMVREAIRVAAHLRKGGAPCPISVNIAASDLQGDKLQDQIVDALSAQGGVAEDLKLELTETSIGEKPDIMRWAIARLRSCGIHTSIDDFGTGYSSLSYLSDFPVAAVKIDRSFVNGMISKKQDKSIVRSTIAMGHDLGLVVIAEGVENETQLSMLRSYGCDQVQGYLISKPLTEAGFLDFVRRYRVEQTSPPPASARAQA